MKYVAPELLLVGAAQNLVLNDTSVADRKSECTVPDGEDGPPSGFYNIGGEW